MEPLRANSGSPTVEALAALLRDRRIVVLAGAGCSTESGIPDYRGPAGQAPGHTPIQFHEFVHSAEARARYWARSTVGWPRFAAATPNAAHVAIAALEAGAVAAGVITQNVDGLHHAAGSHRVVELHGSLAAVRCIGCGGATCRHAHQQRLLAMNGAWADRLLPATPAIRSAPDGDAELNADAIAGFRVPDCMACGGMLKPDVVLFGENVPPSRVQEAWALFDAADALLVAGSSLTVFSGRRFIYRAQRHRIPIAIVNLGPTRADALATLKVEERLGAALPRLADLLLALD
jgi:NAD+-dependent protein deacetylase sirtuin 4